MGNAQTVENAFVEDPEKVDREPRAPRKCARPLPPSSDQPNCWTLIPSQSQRLLLIRSSEANNHSKASQIQARGSARGEALSPAKDLWKDLAKFGNKVTPSTVDESVHDEDGDADGTLPPPPPSVPQLQAQEEETTPQPPVSQPKPSARASSSVEQKVLFRHPVEIITVVTNGAGGRSLGTLEVTQTTMTYTRIQEDKDFDFNNSTGNNEFMWACRSHPTCSWKTSDIKFMIKRQHLMKGGGAEVFFGSVTCPSSSVYFSFESTKQARELFDVVRARCRPRNFVSGYWGDPRRVLQRALFASGGGGGAGGVGSTTYKTLTAAWQSREMSNFDYLLQLNLIAGRSFNDLSQYPVMPWIIADYTSKTLDLKNPATFRDLNYPIKAQRPEQREAMKDRYDSMLVEAEEEGATPPRHTGSHYSTPGHVIWFLVRVEPFTSLHVWFMHGRFDAPDRLFDSIRGAHEGSVGANLMDVKELIPEFFFNADFLENTNSIDLGRRESDGRHVSTVQLPPWAKNAHEFVRLNREALECDHVSRNLHSWIDLIFGHSQRPPHVQGGNESSVAKFNVFSNLTYSGAVDLGKLSAEDHSLYLATLRQISEFGQCPQILFTERHVIRRSLLDLSSDVLCWPIASVLPGARGYAPSLAELARYDSLSSDALTLHKPKCIASIEEVRVSQFPVLFCSEMPGFLVTVDAARIVGLHALQKQPLDSQPPFVLKADRRSRLLSEGKQGVALMSLSERARSVAGVRVQQRERVVGVGTGGHFADKDSWSPLLPGGGVVGGAPPAIPPFVPASKASVIEREEARKQRRQASSSSSSSSSSSNHQRKRQSQLLQRISVEETSAWEGPGLHDHLGAHIFALAPTHKLLFSAGHCDCSVKATMLDSGRLVQSVDFHGDVVGCLALAAVSAADGGGYWLVTGSRDCTVGAWLLRLDDELPMDAAPTHVLLGHEDSVTAVAVQQELDVVISGSDDGLVLIHTLREGLFLRSVTVGVAVPSALMSVKSPGSSAAAAIAASAVATGGDGAPPTPPRSPPRPTSEALAAAEQLSPAWSERSGGYGRSRSQSHNSGGSSSPLRHSVTLICIAAAGEPFFVVYSADGHRLFSFHINGRLVTALSAGERLYSLCASEDGKVLVSGGRRGLIVLRWFTSLKLANDQGREGLDAVVDGSAGAKAFSSPVRSLFFTAKEQHLVVGLESGHMRIMTNDSEYLRVQLHSRLQRTGFLR